MDNRIERMNKRRKRLIWIFLLGTIAAFGVFMYPSVVSIYLIAGTGWVYRILPGALGLWSLILLVLLLRPRLEKRQADADRRSRSRRRVSTRLVVVSLFSLVLLLQLLASRWIGYSAWSFRYLEIGLVSWFGLCVVMAAFFGRYRHNLKRDPVLRSAVNDERIKLNWLKAYRLGFFVICGIAVVWKWSESSFSYEQMFRRLRLPDGPWLIFFGALISLLGAFLAYDRESRDE